MKQYKVWLYHPEGNYFVIEEAESLEWLKKTWSDEPFCIDIVEIPQEPTNLTATYQSHRYEKSAEAGKESRWRKKSF